MSTKALCHAASRYFRMTRTHLRVRCMSLSSRPLLILAAALAWGLSAEAQVRERFGGDPLGAFAATTEIGRAPPAVVEAPKQAAAPVRFQLEGEPALSFEAEPMAHAQARHKRDLAASSAQGERRKIARIGYPRELVSGPVRLNGALLPWQTQADGRRLVGASFNASLAAGLRVQYAIYGAPVTLRFAGSGRPEVYEITPPLGEPQWSPVLEGERARVELELAAGVDPARVEIEFIRLSHLEVAGASLLRKHPENIGDSGICNIDVACVQNPSQALLAAARSVAKYVFSDRQGNSSLCTGTLVNSVPSSNVPYFLTAAHCIGRQDEADSLVLYWFFDAVACDSLAIPDFVVTFGGATLLTVEENLDFALLRLRQSPPSGAVFSAWNAGVLRRQTPAIALHHPAGDLKKFSQGFTQGYARGSPALNGLFFGYDSFIEMRWRDGTTEGGSSGSGLFTFNASPAPGFPSGYYELRGVLSGGDASCQNPSGRDLYGRLDLMMAKLAPYLHPASLPPRSDATTRYLVEYYNPKFDYYFSTSREDDKALLDSHRETIEGLENGQQRTRQVQTFYRTGYFQRTSAQPTSGLSPLTRYFMRGAAVGSIWNKPRGSHFYIASDSERNEIRNTGKEIPDSLCESYPIQYFCNEGTDSFVGLPVAGACFSNEIPVVRLFKGPPRYVNDGNHRFVADPALRAFMRDELGWSDEGVKFCVFR